MYNEHMQITLLGTGTPAPNPARQQSALLISLKGEHLLFDAGSGLTSQLVKAGFLPQQIDAIFITHHHFDHISGLGEFLLSAWYDGREKPLCVYGPPGTAAIVDALLNQVYAREIAFTLCYAPEMPKISAVVRVIEINSGWEEDNGRWSIHAEAGSHGNNDRLPFEVWPCLGYRLEAAGKRVALSGDTVACEGLNRLADHADLLVQCCYLAEEEISTPLAERQSKEIIASSGQVGRIAAQNEVKKLILTHIKDKSESMMESLVKDIRQSYHGKLVIGEDLMSIEV
jgi:ribonuclease BN (tRNA processing enzyme)